MPYVLAALALIAVGSVAAAVYFGGSSASGGTILTYQVHPVSFDVKIPLNGEMKASRNVEVRNQVEGQTTILSIVAEGTRVKEGDVLVMLASDSITQRLEDARIRLDNAVASTINSQEQLKITEMENDSMIKQAEINAELARLEFDQYVKGDSQVQLARLNTELANAKTDLERKTKDLVKIQELAEKQFVSEADVLDTVIAERNSRNTLATAEMNLMVFKEYSEPRQTQTYKRRLDAALAELERARARAGAQLGWRQADLRARQSTQRVEEARFRALELQLEACTIRAPQPGMVVYQTSTGGGGGANQQGPLEQGVTVRQNQVLIQLPDTSKMIVEVKLAEQLIDKVKRGQAVTVTVDAVPGKVFTGKVESIAVLPDSAGRWANPNLKEYTTTIVLDSLDDSFKPGFSAKAEILVGRVNDVLAVPLQAVFTSGGKPFVYVGSEKQFERRSVTTGQSSATLVDITEGLSEGESVLLSRPKTATDRGETAMRPDGATPANNGSGRGSGNGSGNGPGGGSGRGAGGST